MAAIEPGTRLAIFPLPDIVLFPTTRLPLHMFEPRYRRLASDAVGGDGVFGMALLRPPVRSDAGASQVFEIGCAGRIMQSRELPDGRYNLLLEGTERFRILGDEPTDREYRVARVEPVPETPLDDLDGAQRTELVVVRDALQNAVCGLLAEDDVAADRIRQRLAPLADDALVNGLAFGLDLEAIEKQGLLECGDVLQRARLLARLLEMQRAQARLPELGRNVN